MIGRLQRYLGWAAIPNVTIWIILLQVAAYICINVPMRGLDPQVMIERLLFVPERLVAGEVWRVVTFLFLPPLANPFWAFFAWYLFWMFGTSLENYWGTFRYNLYLWIGWLATIVAAVLTNQPVTTNAFLELSVFLAFAALCPNFTLLIFFVLPVQIKWLALFTWIVLGWSFITGGWPIRVTVVASVMNYFVFFSGDLRDRIFYGFRRMRHDAARMSRREPDYRHKCRVCGVTDQSDPSIEFRYCSQCEGNLCYCSDHLRTHEHVRLEGEQPAESRG